MGAVQTNQYRSARRNPVTTIVDADLSAFGWKLVEDYMSVFEVAVLEPGHMTNHWATDMIHVWRNPREYGYSDHLHTRSSG